MFFGDQDERVFVFRDTVVVGDVAEGAYFVAAEVLGDANGDGTAGVGVGETQAGGGEAVEVGRLVEVGAVAVEAFPAEVVAEDEEDIHFMRSSFRVQGFRVNRVLPSALVAV